MSADSRFVVERWTRLSAMTSVVAAALLIVLALGPLLFTAGIVDNLTTLFIYLVLAVMWNALAGFAGLVSVGTTGFLWARRLFRHPAFLSRRQRVFRPSCSARCFRD